jgi:hypothetical protein
VTTSTDDTDDKENAVPTIQQNKSTNRKTLPYRSIFAVLTLDSVLIYDTYHMKPLSIIRGIHYANIVDATWTSDGHSLLVCSTDCFVTIIRFAPGELGQVYTKPEINIQTAATAGLLNDRMITTPTTGAIATVSPDGGNTFNGRSQTTTTKILVSSPNTVVRLPPCEPGPINSIVAPPTKRAKTRVAPTLIATPISQQKVESAYDDDKKSSNIVSPKTILPSKRPVPSPTEQQPERKENLDGSEVILPTDAVDKLSLGGDGGVSMDDKDKDTKKDIGTSPSTIVNQPPNKKQKKRIQPFLLAKPLLQQQG